MKKILLLNLALIFATTLMAQTQTIKSGFSLTIPENKIELKAGETKIVEVNINRSVKYSKIPIELMLSSATPDGVDISFERAVDYNESDKMIITTSKNCPALSETFILNGKSKNLNRGVIFTMVVKNDKTMNAEQL